MDNLIRSFLMQIEAQPTIISLMSIAVASMATALIALCVYIKNLHKLLAESYNQRTKDNQQIVEKSTQALVQVAETIDQHTIVSKELAAQIRDSGKDQITAAREYSKTLFELREWFLKEWPKPK